MASVPIGDLYDRLQIREDLRESSVSRAEARYLHRLIRDGGQRRTLDVGLVSGVSAAHIIATNRADYVFIDSAEKNSAIVRKRGADRRPWPHFAEFCTDRGKDTHDAFKRSREEAL